MILYASLNLIYIYITIFWDSHQTIGTKFIVVFWFITLHDWSTHCNTWHQFCLGDQMIGTIIYLASNASSTTTPPQFHLSFAHVLLMKHSACLSLPFYLHSRLERELTLHCNSQYQIIVCIEWLKLLRRYIVKYKDCTWG